MKKTSLSILFALVLCLCLAPLAALAADSGNEITEVTISGITAPAIGGTASTTATAETTGVTAGDVTWYAIVSGDEIAIATGASFNAGNTYKAKVTLTLSEGYTWGETVTVAVDGSTGVTLDQKTGVVTITFPAVPGGLFPGTGDVINSVTLRGITAPAAGAAPTITAPAVLTTGQAFTASTITWYTKTSETLEEFKGSAFAPGTVYAAKVTLTANLNFTWGENATVTVDGAPEGTTAELDGDTNVVTITFPATACTHTGIDAENKCVTCRTPIMATVEIDGKTTYLADLSGINTLIAGKTATVTLLADASGDISVSAGTITLDLNGKTMAGGLTVSGGNVTVNANNGTITGAVNLTNGYLTLNGGTYNGNVTMTSGSLTINDGTFNGTVDLGSTGTARLTSGTFTKLKARKDLKTYLAANCAFVEAENPSRGVPNPGTEVSNVKVIAHYEHTVANGSCTICGKSLAASITNSSKTQYFETLEDALTNAADNSTVTLENGITLTQDISLSGKSITLDLNGKRIQGTGNINIASGATLTLKGTETSEIAAPINVSGTLNVAEAVVLQGVSVTNGHITVDADAKFVSLSITGGTATLNSGTFTALLVGSSETLKEKSFLGTDRAYYNNSSNKWLTDAELEKNTLNNVSVKELPIKGRVVISSTNKKTTYDINTAPVSYAYGDSEAFTATVTLAEGYTSSNATYVWSNGGTNLPSGCTANGNTLTVTFPNTGDYNFTCSVTVDDYTATTAYGGQCSVSKATLTGKYTAPTAKTLTYTGSDQELINAGSFGKDVTTGSNGPTFRYGMENANGVMEWGDAGGRTGWNAGTYTVYWYIKGGANYESVGAESKENPAGSVEVTIDPKPVEPTAALDKEHFTFNGGEKKPNVTVTADNKTLTENTDYTVSYENNINAGENTAKVTVTAKTGSNYKFEPVTKTFTISKADAMGLLGPVTDSCKEGGTRSQTASVANVGMPADAGTLSYSVGSHSVDGTATVSSFTVDQDGLVKYTITGGVAGAVITLPVKINSTNYAESTVNVVVTLTEKDTQAALNITSGTTVTYGQTLTLATAGGSSTGAVSYEVVSGGTGEATISGSTLTATKAGTVKVKATKAADDDYTSVESAVVTITVNKATPTGAPKYTAITTSGKKLSDAGLAANENWPNGTIMWVDADGNALSGETAVEANKSYRWEFTPTDGDNYNAIDGNVTLWNYTPPTVIVPSAPSTSVTVPVSSDSGKVEVKAEVSKGNATVEISDKQIEQVAANGSGTVTVDVSGLKNVESATVPSHVVEKANEAEDTGLTVALPSGSVTLDETALESVTEAAGGKDVTVSVVSVPTSKLPTAVKEIIGMEPTVVAVVDVNITVGNAKQSSFSGGKVTISVPYTPKKGEDTGKLTVWFIKDDGTIENKGGYYDAEKKCFVFETEHLSQYLLVNTNELVSFTDVPANAYYAAAVNWAAKQNITGGIGNNLFAPDASCTRAQIVTFLWRAAGSPEPKAESSFSDVPAETYYAKAVAWAVENGITTGTSETTFSPDATCTRAQAVTFLYRSERANGGGFTGAWMFRLPFGDVPEWCYEAVAWCYMNDITGGTSETTFSPDANCTRAQIVTMLYRLLVE